jgi:hypothetical protein
LPFDGFVPVLVQGVEPLAQGVVCAPPLAFGLSLCGVAGVALDPVAPVEEPVLEVPLMDEPDCGVVLPLVAELDGLEEVPLIEDPDCELLELPFIVEEDEPVVLLGVALSWVLDGVEGVEGELVVVVVCFVVVVSVEGVVLLAPDWLLVVSVLVLCASASVPVRSRPAATIDNFFM